MKTINLPSSIGNQSRFILAATIGAALTFAACERKSTTVEMPLPANPVVQAIPPGPPVTQSALPVDQMPQPIHPAQPVAITETFETTRLGDAIETFEKAPTAENQSSVNLAFAKLDVEIVKLNDRVARTDGVDRAEASAKLTNMQNYRKDELLRYTKDQDNLAISSNPPVDARSGAQKVKDTAVMVGDKIEDGAKDAGRTLKHAAQNTGEAIKDTVH